MSDLPRAKRFTALQHRRVWEELKQREAISDPDLRKRVQDAWDSRGEHRGPIPPDGEYTWDVNLNLMDRDVEQWFMDKAGDPYPPPD